MDNLHITLNYCEYVVSILGVYLDLRRLEVPFQFFTFALKNDFFASYFLLVHVLDQEVGPKGTQEHQVK